MVRRTTTNIVNKKQPAASVTVTAGKAGTTSTTTKTSRCTSSSSSSSSMWLGKGLRALWFVLVLAYAFLLGFQLDQNSHLQGGGGGALPNNNHANAEGLTSNYMIQELQQLQRLAVQSGALLLNSNIFNNTSSECEKSVSTTAETYNDNQELLEPNHKLDSCQAIVQRMLDWNYCWWHSVATKQQQHNSQNKVLLLDSLAVPSCPIHVQEEIHGTQQHQQQKQHESIGAPVMNLAYYYGQGFGRVVEHTTTTCIMAFLLRRPCLINLNSRDPYYTWRSFLQENTYHWDPEVLYDDPESSFDVTVIAQQMDQLAQTLPNQESDHWQGQINPNDYEYNNHTTLTQQIQQPSLVFPMEQTFTKNSWNAFYDYYHGNHPTRRHQILVSPNWGNAWFMKIRMDSVLKQDYRCQRDHLDTLVQNMLYRPTAMTWQLFTSRYQQAQQTVWKQPPNNNNNNGDDNNNNNPAMMTTTDSHNKLPSILAHRPSSNNNYYGTIHIRLYFINLRRQGQTPPKPPIPVQELAEHLMACMDMAAQESQQSQSSSSPKSIKNWWFLGDNAVMTANVAQEIQQQRPNEVAIFHDYNLTTATMKFNQQPSKHTKDASAMALYGHDVLGGSMQDWMALQQSEVSIVMADGAFGRTGSKGKGKVASKICGKPGGDPKYFQIFQKVTTSPSPPSAAENKVSSATTTTIPKIKVISYSVYGQRPKYVLGMIATAQMLPKFFPDWQIRVYHDDSVPREDLKVLSQMSHVRLVDVTAELPLWVSRDVNPMVWRFLVASDPSVEAYLIRDSDSRPSGRERAAVDEWLRSGTAFHIMRDNSMHDPSTFAAMLGGMWGGLHRAIPIIDVIIEDYYVKSRQQQKKETDLNGYGEDQVFLWKHVLPRAKDDVLQHDSHHCIASGGIAFPLESEEAGDDKDDFVGSVHSPNGMPIPEAYQKDKFRHTKRYQDCLSRRRQFIADLEAKHASTTILPCTPYIGSMIIPTERNN